MRFVEKRTTEEYELENGLVANVRIRHFLDSSRIDLSVFERYVEVPELHLYSNTSSDISNINGWIDICGMLENELRIRMQWKKHKEEFLNKENQK